MDGKLNIIREERPGHILFRLEGRIDAYWSKYLDEALDNAFREREYNIALDMGNIEYLSSLGIRSLIRYAKMAKGVNGVFGISASSKEVQAVLEMVGLAGMLEWKRPEINADKTEDKTTEFQEDGFIFKVSEIKGKENGTFKCTLNGDPEGIKKGFTQKDCISAKFGSGKYGLGLGAIGSGFDDCKSRFGEYIALGDAVAFMPSGDVNTPDFMITEGSLIPSINMLYGISLEGSFSHFIKFSPSENRKSVTLSSIINTLAQKTGFREFAMIMMAESKGLVGVALRRSPVALENDELFSFPQIKENLNLTTEPEYTGDISLSLSIVTRNETSPLRRFTRETAPTFENPQKLRHHTHSAIFGYKPIAKSQIAVEEAIKSLFDEERLESVMHLLNDRRDATGAGESEFTQGVCWIGKIDKF
ncbi:MAG: STAS domain-containing protein [Bacteroidales bacterium]|nr:STAS domain-containing protein [Bacteroidales bacterium]